MGDTAVPFDGWETEAQRGQLIWQKSHSHQVAELQLEVLEYKAYTLQGFFQPWHVNLLSLW